MAQSQHEKQVHSDQGALGEPKCTTSSSESQHLPDLWGDKLHSPSVCSPARLLSQKRRALLSWDALKKYFRNAGPKKKKKKKCWSLCRWTKETGQARARAWVWVNVPQHAGKEDLESFATLVESGRMAKILAATPGRQCCWSLCHGAILSSGRDSSVICRTQCRMEVWGPCSKSRKKWGAWVAQGVKKQEEVTF